MKNPQILIKPVLSEAYKISLLIFDWAVIENKISAITFYISDVENVQHNIGLIHVQ